MLVAHPAAAAAYRVRTLVRRPSALGIPRYSRCLSLLLTSVLALAPRVTTTITTSSSSLRSAESLRDTCRSEDHPDYLICGTGEEEVFTQAVPMRGMHILRAVPSSAVPHCGVPACPLFELEVWVDGLRELQLAPSHYSGRLTVDCRNATPAAVKTLLTQPIRSARSSGVGLEIPPEGSVARHALQSNPGVGELTRPGRENAKGEETTQSANEWGFYTPRGHRIRAAEGPLNIDATGSNRRGAATSRVGFAEGFLQCEWTLAFENGLFMWPGVQVGYRRTIPVELPFLSVSPSQNSNGKEWQPGSEGASASHFYS